MKGLALTDEQQGRFGNEILRLRQLGAGLAHLYATVKTAEEKYAREENVPSFSFGDDPRQRIPGAMLLCMFHWYATSVCNLTRLIGLIAHEAGLTGFESRAAALHYCVEVCGPVKVYRDKVAAHFARISPRSADNVADQLRSIIDDLTWNSGRFWVGALRLHVGETSPTHEYTWSLTEFHERQGERYLPPPEARRGNRPAASEQAPGEEGREEDPGSPFTSYFAAQQSNLEQIKQLPHFEHLIEAVASLYELSIGALAPDKTQPLYGRLLLVCHKGLMSAAALIGRGQPDDSAGITRRAIEAACLARAIRHDKENLTRWLAYEERLARWNAREHGRRPKRLSPGIIDPQGNKTVEWLRGQLGILSDAAVHFTPEFFDEQDWRRENTGDETIGIRLQYFEPSQRKIERALLALGGVHLHILELFNECFDNAFHADARWRRLREEIQRRGNALAKATGLPVGPEEGGEEEAR